MMRKLQSVMVALAGCLVLAAPALAQDTELIVDLPFVQVTRQDSLEACAFLAAEYEDFTITGQTASLTLIGAAAEPGSCLVRGHGVRRISWEPASAGMEISFEFAEAPEYQVVNAVPGTKYRQAVPQVVTAFSFAARTTGRSYPVLGSHPADIAGQRQDEHGTYQLPAFPAAKYSDALVTLNVRNTDFRDVLWLMSEIGGVSIILDPYWDQEPTGGTRPPGGGGNPGGNGGGENGGPGFRPGGEFDPIIPRDGTGSLTLNFKDVPFDTALDLILMAVGLVKAEIHPAA